MAARGVDINVQTVEAALDRIERLAPQIGAFVEVLAEGARAAVARRHSAVQGRLSGVPLGVKELFEVTGAHHACGSDVRGDIVATKDAEAVRRLASAGAVVVGTTRSHEFGWGITTQHAGRGSTRNPRALDRIAGGSSGGSAAAVAAGLVPLALGTDTGGSIRLPAAFCGVMGLKTTWGVVPTAGCFPLAPSFDTVGLLAADIDVLQSGWDALRDGVAGPQPATFRFAAPLGLQPRQLSRPRQAALENALQVLATVGGELHEVADLDSHEVSSWFVPQIMAEAHHLHASVFGTWPGDRERYGRDLAARLAAAETVDLEAVLDARYAAKGFVGQLLSRFGQVDVVVTVVGATGPSRLDDPNTVNVGDERISLLEATMPSTLPQNLAGLPSLTVPLGRDEDGLPVGIQLTGRPWAEDLLIEIGRRLDQLSVLEERVVDLDSIAEETRGV